MLLESDQIKTNKTVIFTQEVATKTLLIIRHSNVGKAYINFSIKAIFKLFFSVKQKICL